MDQQGQANFGGQGYVNPGGAQGDFGSFGMSGGAGGPGVNSGMGYGANLGMNPGANPGIGYGANPGMNPGANPGMGYGMNPNTNPGGGVVFTSAGVPEKKSNKKLIIIGAVILVLVIILGILALVFSGGGSGGLFGGGAPAGFSELREFIEKGDAETQALFANENSDDSSSEESAEESSEEPEYIMAIRISEKGETEVRKYYAKLAKLEQEFYNKSATKMDSALLAEYGNALRVLKNAINYYEAKEGLIAAYENGGESGAEAYFEENIKCGTGVGDLASVCNLEEKYYTAVLTEHKVYAEAGCYKNDYYNMECAWGHYGLSEFTSKTGENGRQRGYYLRMSSSEMFLLLSKDVVRLNMGVSK